MKMLALYAAMIAAGFGVQHALLKLSHDFDAPILAIVQAQASQPFGYQLSPSQLNTITSQNAATIAADKASLAKAEQVAP